MKKFVARVLQTITVVGTVIITPIAVNYADKIRGYKAMGGEYLIPLLGLLIVMIIEEVYEESKKKRKKGGK